MWKCVLVSCEAPCVIELLSQSSEAWELLYTVRASQESLLVFEPTRSIRLHSHTHHVWFISLKTLYYSFHGDLLFGVAIASERSALVLDLLKLVAVLANAMQWTKEAEDAQPELYASIHR